MNTLEFYAVEARKHGMTYGQYESAIRSGEIPKPKMPKCVHTTHKPKETPLRADDSIPTYRKCRHCRAMFALPNPDSQRQYCAACLKSIQRISGGRRRTLSDYTNCELCGTEFYRGRQKNGNINNRKMCPICHNKWMHMSREQKQEFKAGERTLERLEKIKNKGADKVANKKDALQHVCIDCGQQFPVKSARSTAMYCPECRKIKMKQSDEQRQEAEYCACEICGIRFKRGRDERGKIKHRKYCQDCLAQWRSLSVEQKKAFVSGEKTLERLEEIQRGYKTDC